MNREEKELLIITIFAVIAILIATILAAQLIQAGDRHAINCDKPLTEDVLSKLERK